MSSDGGQLPDLASVLKTLSSFATPQQAPAINRNTFPTQPRSQGALDDEYGPLKFSQVHTSDGLNVAPAQQTAQLRQQPPAGTADPATITTWSSALKYVMKTVGQNEALQSKIRRLIRSQHDHERKWWEAREALLTKQRHRAEKQQKLDEVLKSVGGAITSGPEMKSPEENANELRAYDDKVYSAMSDMSKAICLELRGLGIPFFAIGDDYVALQSTTAEKERGSKPEHTTTGLSPKDLDILRQRMFDLLEDLCKE